MKTFFLDTTYNIAWGIFGEDLTKMTYEKLEDKKSSVILHSNIEKTLSLLNLKLQDSFSHFIHVAGPGFYTGMRVSQIFSSIVEMYGIKASSFYNFELPSWCGEKEYFWVTKAYRGEIFIYSKIQGIEKKQLIKEEEFQLFNFNYPVYIHCEKAIDEKVKMKLNSFKETQELFLTHSKLIIPQVINRTHSPSCFYFRPAEEEFKVSNAP